MAYQFLTNHDLNTRAFDVYINKSNDANTQQVLESLEKQNIAIIKSKLSGKYDTNAIFSAAGENRHYLIIKLLVVLVIYDFIRRNSARKVPNDYVKDWEEAMKTLEAIKAGKERPEGLPVITDTNGNELKQIKFGNNRNNDFYI